MQTSARFDQTLLANHCDVLSPGGGIGGKSRLAGGQKDVGWRVLVDACGQRHNQNRIRALVAISRVQRDDDYGTPCLLRRIHMKLHKPDLAAQRSPAARWHFRPLLSGTPAGPTRP